MWTWKYFPQFWMFGAINNPCQLKNIFRLTIKFWLMRHKMVCAPLKRCKTIYTLKLSNMRPPLPFLQIITITLLSIITPATSNHRWPTPSPTHPQPPPPQNKVGDGLCPPTFAIPSPIKQTPSPNHCHCHTLPLCQPNPPTPLHNLKNFHYWPTRIQPK